MQNSEILKNKITDLIIKAKDGDQESFGIIYSKLFLPIYRYIYFRVNSKAEAEDLTQNVFLKIWLALPNFEAREEKQFMSWCFVIARNSIIDFWRKKKELFLDIENEFKISEEEISITAEDLINEIDIKNIGKQIKDAIVLLNGDKRDVIVLKFINDFSNKEIAEILGKSEEAIRQTQSRALKELKNYFLASVD